MKKIALLLALCAVIGLFGCAESEEIAPTDESVQTENGTVTEDEQMNDSFSPNATIVNKNGAKGVVTYVIDDYFRSEASFAMEMMDTYENLTFSFAVTTKDLATFKTERGSDGKLEYVKDSEGKYVYDVNEANVEFLQNVLDTGKAEIISHSHSHDFWGLNDDGGVFEYMKNDGSVHTSAEMPVGSASKELYASKQIIKDLFPDQRSISFVAPGIGVKTVDVTYGGKTLVAYSKYFNELLSGVIDDGVYIGSRGTFQATSGFDKYVNTRFSLATLEGRSDVKAFMILDKNAGDDIENWKEYIDEALKLGGWACFCIHKMTPKVDNNYHYILQKQANQLFKYTDSLGDDVWVAPFTDAMLYFSEWSSAKAEAEYADGCITVKLTDKENDAIYDLPLTVKVSVPSTWSKASAGGKTLEVQQGKNGAAYVYVDVVPDSEPVRITAAD